MEQNKNVAYWLFACCVGIALMVSIGGLTRLTGSGLSMTDWHPVYGILPPFNEADWQALFISYQQIPEFKLINSHFNLEDFKQIFWLEYIHRVAGRLVGVIFVVPLIHFAVTKQLSKPLLWRLLGFFVLGGLQGLIGWWMVKSGLRDRPDVHPLWLTTHLLMAFTLFSMIFWTAMQLLKVQPYSQMPYHAKNFTLTILCLVTVQIALGGMVAGTNAGLIYNSFPDMNGVLVAPEVMMPWFSGGEAQLAVVMQFLHRKLAWILIVLIPVLVWMLRKSESQASIYNATHMLLGFYVLQFILGVLTLLGQVPLVLASLHQVNALFLLATLLVVLYKVVGAKQIEVEKAHGDQLSGTI